MAPVELRVVGRDLQSAPLDAESPSTLSSRPTLSSFSTLSSPGDGDCGSARLSRIGGEERSSTRIKIVDAALECIARRGIQKTRVEEIARVAGLSRATLYRAFPGGKDDVLEAVVGTEVARLFAALGAAMGEAHDLEDVLVAGISEASRWINDHDALSYVMGNEPQYILPHLSFSKMDQLLLTASGFAAPFFMRWLDSEQALRVAEWAIRIVISYTGFGDPPFDLGSPEEARHLVKTFILPGVLALKV
ncbi:MAG: TetR/AcrR family transcriptional regulator [Acidimicrobiales bacterium]